MGSELFEKRLQKIPQKIKIISDNTGKYDAVYYDISNSNLHFEVIREILQRSRISL